MSDNLYEQNNSGHDGENREAEQGVNNIPQTDAAPENGGQTAVETGVPRQEEPRLQTEAPNAYSGEAQREAPPAPPFTGYNGGAQGYREMNGATGEYRYVPPFHNGVVPPPPMPPQKHKKEKKKADGRSFSAGGIALIVAACILVSFGAGFGGATLAGHLTGTGTGASDSGELVIYKTAVVADADGNEIKDELTTAQVADIVRNSVVEITTEFLTSYGPYQYVSSGAGSGVIISKDGYIVTNNHVITGNSSQSADAIKVRLTDGTEYSAKLVGKDSDSDIALIKIDASDLTCAVFGDSDSLVVGDKVLAVGNPLGKLGGTVTGGMISATGRTINVDGTEMTLLQTDTAVNPGNSGGGLFNMKGELVGIVNAKSTGTGVEGLAFAIPINEAGRVVSEIKENGYVTGRTYIGVSFYDVSDPYTAYKMFGTQYTGIYVYQTVKGYNDNILKSGDRVVAVNGNEVNSSENIKTIVKAAKVGDVLKFSVYRDGRLIELDVTCYEYVPESSVKFENS